VRLNLEDGEQQLGDEAVMSDAAVVGRDLGVAE